MSGAAPAGDDPGKPRLRPIPPGKRANGTTHRPDARKDMPQDAPPGAEDEKPRRRRRPDRDSLETAAKRLMGWHTIVAGMMKAPELMIGPDEAMQLVITGGDLAAEFDLEVGGKVACAIAFVGTAASVYFPRFVAVGARVAAARAAAQAGAEEAGPVINPDGSPAHGQAS